jgi:hypothetical protein
MIWFTRSPEHHDGHNGDVEKRYRSQTHVSPRPVELPEAYYSLQALQMNLRNPFKPEDVSGQEWSAYFNRYLAERRKGGADEGGESDEDRLNSLLKAGKQTLKGRFPPPE